MQVFLASLLAMSNFGLANDADALKGQPAKSKITSRRRDDAVEVQVNMDKAVFIVKSPSGISQAVIERLEESWPKAVVLRLHLKGLENFRASNGKVTLDAAVSIQDGKPKVFIWKDENFWMEIRMVGGDSKPAKVIPLKDGYFEIALPKTFFEGNPKTITVNWLDFYRN